jgi:DNA-binding beta-propeller fold protein YncE
MKLKLIIFDATAITIFFRRQAEKSLGLLRIKLQKLTFCKNVIFILLFIINCKNDIQKPSILSLFFPVNGVESEKLGVVTSDFSSGGRFTLIDTASLLPLPSLSNIHSDAVLRYANGKVFIINRLNRDSILVLDPNIAFLPQQEFSVEPGSNPQDIAFINSSKAYISLYNRKYLLVVNPTSGVILGKIDLSAYSESSSGGNSGIDGFPEMSRLALHNSILYIQLQRLDRNHPSGFPYPGDDSYLLRIDTVTDQILGVTKTPARNPFGKMQIFTLGQEPHLIVCLPGKLGYLSELDGGIAGYNLAKGEFRESFLLLESEVGGDILDMVLKSETEGYAFVLDRGFNKSIVRFNPSTGKKISTIASYTSSAGNISGLALSSSGKLFLGDSGISTPGVSVFDTNQNPPVLLTPTPLSVGLKPFEMEILK